MTREILESGDTMVIFGMPEEEYHKHAALGSSGVRDLLISPLTFWAKSNMNPDKEEEETDAKDYGKAYHKLLLEGEDAFNSSYTEDLDPADYEDCLKSGEQLREKCVDLGLSKSGTIAEMTKRIHEKDSSALLWLDLITQHQAKHSDKIFLSRKNMMRLWLGKRSIDASEAAEMLDGGHSEVSIFWTDKITGVKCKARFDKLKPNHINDLKTFSNSKGKILEKSVHDSITNYKYSIQARMYIDGLENVLETIKDERLGSPDDAVKYSLIFQESGAAPNVVIRDFERYNPAGENAYWLKADSDYRAALDIYAKCLNKYDKEPWVEPTPRRSLHDTDLPAYHFA